jgi:hypothetical protein
MSYTAASKKWILAHLTGIIPPELRGLTPKVPTPGEVVAFVQALDPDKARKYAQHHDIGPHFKKSVEPAYAEYQAQLDAEKAISTLPILKKPNGELMDRNYVMRMPSDEYARLVFKDGRPKPGVRERLALILKQT